MKLEQGEISNQQLMFLVAGFSQGMILTINFTYAISKHDTWFAVLAGFVLALPALCLYTAIAQAFPGQTLPQVHDAVFGPWLGKLVTASHIWFMFQLTVHYLYFLNSFWLTYIMPETPRAAFLIMFALVCAMAVRQGVEVIARCSFPFAVVVAATILITTVLLTGDMEPAYLLPVLEATPRELLQSVHIILSIPFFDMVVFLAIFPYAAEKRRVRKPVLLGISMSAAQLLVVVLRDALVLGPRILNISSASFAVTRQIDIAEVLTRLDILIAITILITIFMKVTLCYYATVLSLAQTLKLRSYLPLVTPVGVIVVAVAATLYSSDMEQSYSGCYVWPFSAMVHEILIPALTLVAIAVRRLSKREGKAPT